MTYSGNTKTVSNPGQDLCHTIILNHTIKLIPGSKAFTPAPSMDNAKIREELSRQVYKQACRTEFVGFNVHIV